MARLILMRHGRPELDLERYSSHWLSADAMARLIEDYEPSPLDLPQSPPKAAVDLAQSADYALVSPMARAIDSFKALGLELDWQMEQDLSEAPMPRPRLPAGLSFLRLPGLFWAIGLRLFWWAGFLQGSESFKACKARAHLVASDLEIMSHDHETILIVGHGFFNHMLGRVLKQSGWQDRSDLMDTSARSGYWSCTLFEKDT